MTVHFVGAGPGAADLITVRGRDILSRSPVCMYAGSIIAPELLDHCPANARKINTAPMSLDELEQEFLRAFEAGEDVARLHSGDLSVWSAVAEQIRRLNKHAIPYTMTPGVPSFAAAASALGQELTIPEIAQSLVLTRISGRASKMPTGENLKAFAATGATLAIHLAIHALETIVEELTPFYGADCPVAIVFHASWEDERIVRGTLGTIVSAFNEAPVERTALILVGPGLDPHNQLNPETGLDKIPESSLYDTYYQRRFRGRGT